MSHKELLEFIISFYLFYKKSIIRTIRLSTATSIEKKNVISQIKGLKRMRYY